MISPATTRSAGRSRLPAISIAWRPALMFGFVIGSTDAYMTSCTNACSSASVRASRPTLDAPGGNASSKPLAADDPRASGLPACSGANGHRIVGQSGELPAGTHAGPFRAIVMTFAGRIEAARPKRYGWSCIRCELERARDRRFNGEIEEIRRSSCARSRSVCCRASDWRSYRDDAEPEGLDRLRNVTGGSSGSWGAGDLREQPDRPRGSGTNPFDQSPSASTMRARSRRSYHEIAGIRQTTSRI